MSPSGLVPRGHHLSPTSVTPIRSGHHPYPYHSSSPSEEVIIPIRIIQNLRAMTYRPLTTPLLLLAMTLLTLVACGPKEKKSYEKYAVSGLTERTEHLRSNLQRFSQQGVIIGQEYATLQGVGWRGDSCRSDINSVCNDFPAANAYSLNGLERDMKRNADGFTADELRTDILAMARRGGLIVCRWQMQKPKDDAEQKQWVGNIARFLDSLEDGYGIHAPVMLLLLPLDNDAWYASLDPKAYRSLYRTLSDGITDAGAKNVIYGYSCHITQPADTMLSRFPDGIASLIDIEALSSAADHDAYATAIASVLQPLRQAADSYGVALGITLGIGNADTDRYWEQTVLPVITTVPLSYALFGTNKGQPESHHIHTPFPGGKGINGFMRLYNDPKTLFAHDINGLYL